VRFQVPTATHRPDNGGRKHLWNVCKLLPQNTAQNPRRLSSSHSALVYGAENLKSCSCSAGQEISCLWRAPISCYLIHNSSPRNHIQRIRQVQVIYDILKLPKFTEGHVSKLPDRHLQNLSLSAVLHSFLQYRVYAVSILICRPYILSVTWRRAMP
jgi:hypothetical protein